MWFTNDGSVDEYVPGQNRRSRVTLKISKQFVIDLNSYKSSQMKVYVLGKLLSLQIVRFS